MKRLFTIMVVLPCVFPCFCQEVVVSAHFAPYDDLFKMVKIYFRSDPYNGEFSAFLNHLINDPTLTNKSMMKRTDSALFSFKGEYQHHSPFGFKADRTEIRLTEREFDATDSLHLKDTLLVYQLLGYSYGGKEGLDAVQREFIKFNRKYGKRFRLESSDIKKQEEVIGAMKDYFVEGLPTSPLTVAWGKPDQFQNVFIITLRLTVKENQVQLLLPIPVHTD